MQDDQSDELLTYTQVAALLCIRIATIYSMVSRREIPYVRLGRRLVRFSKRRILQWVGEKGIEPGLDDRRQGRGTS